MISEADSTITSLKNRVSKCKKANASPYVITTLNSRQTALSNARDNLFREVRNKINAMASTVGISTGGLQTVDDLRSKLNEIKGTKMVGELTVTPVSETTMSNVRSAIDNAKSVMEKFPCAIPRKPPKPKPAELGEVTLDIFRTPGTEPVKAIVGVKSTAGTPLKGAKVTVYWDTCPKLLGGCATDISSLKKRGKSKSGTTDVSGTTSVLTLEPTFSALSHNLFAFAEVTYKGALTQTPVKSVTLNVPGTVSAAIRGMLREAGATGKLPKPVG